jgi:hypothetical protein
MICMGKMDENWGGVPLVAFGSNPLAHSGAYQEEYRAADHPPPQYPVSGMLGASRWGWPMVDWCSHVHSPHRPSALEAESQRGLCAQQKGFEWPPGCNNVSCGFVWK